MSLINQMLKDLEQRGGFPSDTKFEPAKSKSLGTEQVENKGKYTFLKISGALILLYCAVYIWVKNPNIFKAPHTGQTANVPVTPAPAAPAPENVTNTTALPNTPAPISQVPIAEVPVTEVPVAQASTQQPHTATPMMAEKNSEVDVKQNSAPMNAAPVETQPKKTANTAVTQKTQRPTAPAPAASPMDFENIAPATIAPSEPKQSNLQSAKPFVSHPVNQTVEGFTKQENSTQKSANLYSLALKEFEKGRTHEAEDYLAKAISENPANEDARQMLAALMVDNKKMTDAKNLLADGLVLNPQQTGFRMAVARLQFESGDQQGALQTLVQGANDARKDAEYQSFLATLLQRAERHEEAVNYYNAAISLQPPSPNMLIGLGISQQALGKFEEAQSAYTRALSNNNLSPELTNFVEQRLKQVNQHLKAH